ncbi:MAG: hypothetical protein M3Y41_08565 [Pseudomonadota bacterium]|nr:hypothetical protein [Pseudomonadota bacterium]
MFRHGAATAVAGKLGARWGGMGAICPPGAGKGSGDAAGGPGLRNGEANGRGPVAAVTEYSRGDSALGSHESMVGDSPRSRVMEASTR